AFDNGTTETDATYTGRYAWTGRERDAETGLQYNRARYYDPDTGRWLSQDPLGFDAGDSNLYRYVANRPTSDKDPSGLSYMFVNGGVAYYQGEKLTIDWGFKWVASGDPVKIGHVSGHLISRKVGNSTYLVPLSNV